MKRGAPLAIGPVTYPNRTAAVKAVGAILQSRPLNRRLDGEDAEVAMALFDMHPGAPEKAPRGAVGHTIRRIVFREGIPQRCFFAILPDGTEVDWSYRVALGVVPCGPSLTDAARAALADHVAAFKTDAFSRQEPHSCAASGRLITFDEAHVDHAPPWPFVAILRAFVAEFGAPAVVAVEPWGSDFADPADKARFLAFHHARAVLRILDGKVNIGRGARG